MTEKILYQVLCDEYEEVARIFFEIKETGEQIEGTHQIQKWVNSLFEENEQLKSIKKFADRNGICIFNIDEAFRRCWNDNAKLVKENEQLKNQNELLSDELEQCKAVIDNKWSEYLKKKEEQEND